MALNPSWGLKKCKKKEKTLEFLREVSVCKQTLLKESVLISVSVHTWCGLQKKSKFFLNRKFFLWTKKSLKISKWRMIAHIWDKCLSSLLMCPRFPNKKNKKNFKNIKLYKTCWIRKVMRESTQKEFMKNRLIRMKAPIRMFLRVRRSSSMIIRYLRVISNSLILKLWGESLNYTLTLRLNSIETLYVTHHTR